MDRVSETQLQVGENSKTEDTIHYIQNLIDVSRKNFYSVNYCLSNIIIKLIFAHVISDIYLVKPKLKSDSY